MDLTAWAYHIRWSSQSSAFHHTCMPDPRCIVTHAPQSFNPLAGDAQHASHATHLGTSRF
eukprot:12639273-Alexandrium_andersonii.AAC.1